MSDSIEETTTTSALARPSLMRIARRGGIKSLSEDCYPEMRQIVNNKLEEILRVAMIVNGEKHTKTLMVEDIYETLALLGHHVTRSNDLGTTTCSK
tara:strand:- start:465 stop:752 length:288 start_codon:yes stop_codon:yes gene_type:complete